MDAGPCTGRNHTSLDGGRNVIGEFQPMPRTACSSRGSYSGLRPASGAVETYMALLRAGSGLFAASGEVNAIDFTAFVDGLELRQGYPGIQGIGYAPEVTFAQRDSLVAAVREQLFPSYQISPFGDRAQYFPVVYLEPVDERNKGAIGYDMFSEPVRRLAMENATATAAMPRQPAR